MAPKEIPQSTIEKVAKFFGINVGPQIMPVVHRNVADNEGFFRKPRANNPSLGLDLTTTSPLEEKYRQLQEEARKNGYTTQFRTAGELAAANLDPTSLEIAAMVFSEDGDGFEQGVRWRNTQPVPAIVEPSKNPGQVVVKSLLPSDAGLVTRRAMSQEVPADRVIPTITFGDFGE